MKREAFENLRLKSPVRTPAVSDAESPARSGTVRFTEALADMLSGRTVPVSMRFSPTFQPYIWGTICLQTTSRPGESRKLISLESTESSQEDATESRSIDEMSNLVRRENARRWRRSLEKISETGATRSRKTIA